jgi:hypothetical protein
MGFETDQLKRILFKSPTNGNMYYLPQGVITRTTPDVTINGALNVSGAVTFSGLADGTSSFVSVDPYGVLTTNTLTLDATNISYFAHSFVNVHQALDSLLRVAPTVSMAGGSVNEVGSTVSTVPLTWTLSGDTPVYSTLTDVIGFDINVAGGGHTFTGLSLTTDKIYTVTVGDTYANPSSSSSQTVHFTQKVYYGDSINTSLTSAQVVGLANGNLQDTEKGTYVMNGNAHYLYIAYRASYGDDQYNIWVGGFNDTSWVKTTVSVTNLSGATESFYVYRSLYIQNGTGIVVEIR